jgi:hypothetical protein
MNFAAETKKALIYYHYNHTRFWTPPRHKPEPVVQSISTKSDCGSEGMGFDPHSSQSKVRLFSLSILTDKIVLVVQSCRVPTPPSTGSLVSV